jgi:hypothetical protein
VAAPMIFPVIPNCITGKKATHEFRNALLATKYQKMNVIFHQGPSKDFGSGLLNHLIDAGEEISPILIIPKYRSTFNSADHDVMKSSRGI